jgi:hypothetical protein
MVQLGLPPPSRYDEVETSLSLYNYHTVLREGGALRRERTRRVFFLKRGKRNERERGEGAELSHILSSLLRVYFLFIFFFLSISLRRRRKEKN